MEYKKLEQLLAHPENEQLLPPLTSDEYNGLKKSLSEKFKEIPLEIMEQDKAQYTLLTGEYIVLDGNNRLKILREIGYNKPIPVIIHKYMEEAKQRTFIENAALNKRNLTKEAKVEIAQRQVARGISQAEVAKLLGINQATVSRATADVKEVRKEIETQAVQMLREAGLSTREIEKETGVSHGTVVKNMQMHKNDQQPNIDKPSPEIAKNQVKILLSEDLILEKAKETCETPKYLQKQAVRDVKALLSEDAILKAVKARTDEKSNEKTSDKTMNYTNENIEWAKWSWNPVTGCKHDCQYCYAHDIAMRFSGTFEPQFHEDRLSMPANTKIPVSKQNEPGIKNVFVCSMADLFGDWVPQEWIDKVLNICKKNQQWIYLFLTKNPKRYIDIKFPDNCWVGASAPTQGHANKAIEAFSKLKHRPSVLFLSCEPLEEKITLPLDVVIDWIIIGGRSKTSRMPENQPGWDWVYSLSQWANCCGVKQYWKPNLTVRPKEYPNANIK